MHRIDHATAQPNKFGAGKPGFTGGNPTTATPSTRLTPEWCDDVQENLARVIEHAGIALAKGNGEQLYNAIVALIVAAIPSLSDYVLAAAVKGLAYLNAGLGLENDGAGGARVKLDGGTLFRSAAGLKVNLAQAMAWGAQQTPFVGVPLTDAATVNWDVGVNGQVTTLTTLAARTIAAPTNLVAGSFYGLEIVTNGYSPGWNAIFDWGAAGVPSGLTGRCKIIGWYNGTKIAMALFSTGGA